MSPIFWWIHLHSAHVAHEVKVRGVNILSVKGTGRTAEEDDSRKSVMCVANVLVDSFNPIHSVRVAHGVKGRGVNILLVKGYSLTRKGVIPGNM